MRKQTAMQELIEYLEKYKEVIGVTAVMTIDKATKLLELERKQIEDAYIIPNSNIRNKEAAEKYYNATFSTQ